MKTEERLIPVPSGSFVLESLVWIVLTLIAWLIFYSPNSRIGALTIYVSVLSIALGIRVFYGHGRGAVTATGLFGLASAVFIGFSGLLLMSQSEIDAAWRDLGLACLVGLTVQIGTSLLAWGKIGHSDRASYWVESSIANWLTKIGLFVLFIAVATHILVPQLRSWTEATAFSSICVVSGGILLRENTRLVSWRTLSVPGMLLLYSEFFHSGSGRLRIAALACAVLLLFSARFPLRRLKAAIIALLPLAIIWMANNRLEFQESLATGASVGRTGLESMTAGMEVLAILIRNLHDRSFAPELGYNLLSVFAVVIPESIWPGQPKALGYELVQFVSPERYGDGIFSTVATSTGEALFNFGWFGVPLVVVFVAAGLRVLDGLLRRQLIATAPTLLGVLGFILLAMLAGAIADYIWSGVHTYIARMLARLPGLFFIVALAWLNSLSRDRNSMPPVA